MGFQHDGALKNFKFPLKEYLNTAFPHWWIGWRSAWNDRWDHLTSPIYFFWLISKSGFTKYRLGGIGACFLFRESLFRIRGSYGCLSALTNVKILPPDGQVPQLQEVVCYYLFKKSGFLMCSKTSEVSFIIARVVVKK